METILNYIDSNGYFETETTDKEFLDLGMSLGNPISSRKHSSFIDILLPKEQHHAHKFSLSSVYGSGKFPFHTDGAYFHIPPKYILLRFCEGDPDGTPTLLLPFYSLLSEEEKSLLRNEIWSVKGRTFNFYVSALEKNLRGKEWLRHDPGCMRLTTKQSILLKLIEEKQKSHLSKTINWHVGKTIVIDNWKVLHARPKVERREVNIRTLQRIMINE